jgi:replication factor A1
MTEPFENLLNHILSQNPSIDKQELLSLVEKKKQESHGLLSDEGAIRLLAQQWAIPTFSSDEVKDQRIASVQSGLMDASITGEIVSLSEVREFRRSDGSLGKVLRLRLADSSGQITCICWDSIGEFVAAQGLGVGSRLRLEHGYTKYGRGEEVEFHLGSRSSVQLLSARPPAQVSGPARISGLTPGARVEKLRLRIKSILPSKSDKGPTQALCEDETGLVMAKFWDENKSVALTIGQGKTVTLQNPWVREWNGLVDLNVGRGSSITPEEFAVGNAAPVSVGHLTLEPFLKVVSGRVVERSEMREIETREGRKARVSNIRIEDDTGRIRISLWDKHAESVDSLRLGDSVRLTGVKVRNSPTGELEASTVFLTQLEKI